MIEASLDEVVRRVNPGVGVGADEDGINAMIESAVQTTGRGADSTWRMFPDEVACEDC